MADIVGPPTYDELLDTFKGALGYTLLSGKLAAGCLVFDLTVIAALGELARAVSGRMPIPVAVSKACKAFAVYAWHEDQAQQRALLGSLGCGI